MAELATDDVEPALEETVGDADYRTPPAQAERLPSERHAGAKLACFLIVHLVGLIAEFVTIVFFGACEAWASFALVVATICFSGAICTYAAWECETPALGCRWFPLKNQPWFVKCLLVLPLGLGQGVVIALALENHIARTKPERRRGENEIVEVKRFHLKAVNGIFEGIIFAAVVLFTYWGLGFPSQENSITKCPTWDSQPVHVLERRTLKTLGVVLLATAGLGLVELDASVSPTIAQRMQRSTKYTLAHWLYRTCEVVSRTSMLTGFMVLTRQHTMWWWLPLFLDFLLVVILVQTKGGSEVSRLVVLLCAIPCVCANLIRFVDSPAKRRAARNISLWLNIRHFIEIIVLPVAIWVVYYFLPQVDAKDLNNLTKIHTPTTILALVAIALYWPLHLFVGTRIQRDSPREIFSACQQNNVEDVKLLTQVALGISVNCYDIDGYTPLMLAILGSKPSDASSLADICHCLIQNGARVDLPMTVDHRVLRRLCWLPSRRRWTALHLVAWKGCSEDVLRELLPRPQDASTDEESSTRNESSFRDQYLETPLHVSVQFGHLGVTRMLVEAYPEWRDAMNFQSKRPCDLAISQEMRAALATPDEGNNAQQLLSNIAPATSLQSMSANLWPQVVLQITTTFDSKVQFGAPGLCSFVASRAGGPLGRYFCQATPLPSIEEEVNSRNNSNGTSSGDTSASTDEKTELSFRTVDSVPATSSTLSHPSSKQWHVPTLDELEPVTNELAIVGFWRQEMNSRRRRGGSAVGAAFASLIPEEATLGRGTYGVVWRARSQKNGCLYAVKNVRTQHELVATLATRECQIADCVRLQPHPCIVHLYLVHHFAEVGLFMQVMEYCEGGDVLNQIYKERRRAEAAKREYKQPDKALRWIGQVFLGLEHLHLEMKTLLRDLKPDNVVLDARGNAKLTDFGFGRFGADITGPWTFGCPPGSPGYICPEILNQQKYDFKADIYSFGVLVWVMLTGGVTYDPRPRPPWGTKKDATDFRAHLNDWKFIKDCLETPERSGARKLSREFKEFVEKLIQRRASARLDHKGIRQTPLMQSLKLPERRAGRDVIESWIDLNF